MTPKREKILQEQMTAAHKDYSHRLHTYAYFKVNNKQTSEDLVQDTFNKTWAYLVKGGKIELMKAFLYHVLNNLIVDEYRKHKTTSLDALLEKGFEPSTGNPDRLYNILDGKMAFNLIGHLPEKYKTLMSLRYIKELSLKEISVVTKQNKNVIGVQLHRGIEKLRVLYESGVDKKLSPPGTENLISRETNGIA